MRIASSRTLKEALLCSGLAVAASACSLGGPSDDPAMHLRFTVEFRNTATQCPTGYCVTRTAESGSFFGDLTVEGSGATLVTSDGCSRTGTVSADSVRLSYTAHDFTCRSFSMQARIEGSSLTGTWQDFSSDGHGGGTGGSVKTP